MLPLDNTNAQIINQDTTYGELRKALPPPAPGTTPTIERLRKETTLILGKDTDCCTIEVFDNGYCACIRKEKCKVFHVAIYSVLKNPCCVDKTTSGNSTDFDGFPWWEPLEIAGMNRLCFIYDKSTGIWFEVPQKEFAEYNRFRSRVRFREKYHKRCSCPRNKWWLCDGMCHDCEFWLGSGDLSLDSTWENEEGDEALFFDEISSTDYDPDETVPAQVFTKQLLNRLNELMPEASEIGRLRLLGMKDDEIAKAIGIKRTTFHARLEKARRILRKEFKNEFQF